MLVRRQTETRGSRRQPPVEPGTHGLVSPSPQPPEHTPKPGTLVRWRRQNPLEEQAARKAEKKEGFHMRVLSTGRHSALRLPPPRQARLSAGRFGLPPTRPYSDDRLLSAASDGVSYGSSQREVSATPCRIDDVVGLLVHLLPYSTTVCGSAGNSPRRLERDAGTPTRHYHRRPCPSSLTKEGALHRGERNCAVEGSGSRSEVDRVTHPCVGWWRAPGRGGGRWSSNAPEPTRAYRSDGLRSTPDEVLNELRHGGVEPCT